MLVPLSWVRDFTPIERSLQEVAEALNQLGLEVEGVVDPAEGIDAVVAARVLEVKAHPDADKLSLVHVDYGAGTTRVVCGAGNVYAGMVAPLARPGARLPALGDEPLAARTIRGVTSDGMLCSAHELGLGDDHSGIVDLGDRGELGADVRDVLGLHDVVFDLSITPNRPDALSIVGVARELAAHFDLPLELGIRPIPPGSVHAAPGGPVTVEIEAPDRCPRLTARSATVVMGESPDWVQQRLLLAGMRPISNVVDVTNYVMLERGRPLHAFDLAKMGGRGILVRAASKGEVVTTLDGVERTLDDSDLLICDAERTPHAIAGVMGGADAEVSDSTTEIVLESAHFEPSGIARTSKRVGLRSEASVRFERGADPESTVPGADLAMALLAEVADASIAPEAVDEYPTPIARNRIRVRAPRVNSVLGTTIDTAAMQSMLEPLGIDVAIEGRELVVVAPTWRPDLEREIDVVEEIGRRHGLHNIDRSVPIRPGFVGHLSPTQRERRTVVDVLVGAGFFECYTLSLLAPDDLVRSGHALDAVVHVENPLRSEESVLRPTLMPGLLRSLVSNAGRGNPDTALFETGVVFGPPDDGSPALDDRDRPLPTERSHLAAMRSGVIARAPHEPDRDVDPFDVVAVVEALAQALHLVDCRLERAAVPGFHSTRAAQVLVDGEPIGVVGSIAPATLAALELEIPVVALELDVDALLAGQRRANATVEVSRYPSSSIDLAFVVDDTVAAGDVLRTLRAAGGPVLEDARLFDVFRSDQLGARKVSLAYALRFRASDRTLNDQQVGALRKKCIKAVEKAHGATLRS